MEYVGYGILCFGKKNYFNGADHKIEMILKDENRSVFVLTDNVKYFDKYKSNQNLTNRSSNIIHGAYSLL